MIIDCIADLHGRYPELEGGDLLIVAGDLTRNDEPIQYLKFFRWLNRQNYLKIVCTAGNHDMELVKIYENCRASTSYSADFKNIHLLLDNGIEFEGLKIWGSPWTPWFNGVGPHCTAFMLPEDQLKAKWDLAPHDTDILITHGPAYGILDEIADGNNCGSPSLRDRIQSVRPRLFIFGHIHECGGREYFYHHATETERVPDTSKTHCANCSHVDERYRPRHEAMRIEL